MPFKKDLTPLTKKGSVVKHAGKGAAQFDPRKNNVSTMDYAKATPMAQPDNTGIPDLESTGLNGFSQG